MADSEEDWKHEQITVHVETDYRDPTPTADLVVTPGIDLTDVANQKATEILQKMKGRDVRTTLAQWLKLSAYLGAQGLDTLTQMQLLVSNFEKSVNTSIAGIEVRQTGVETKLNDFVADQTNSGVDKYSLELVAARTRVSDGKTFPTLGDYLADIQSIIDMYVPVGYTVTITHGLNHNPSVAAFSFNDGLGVEKNGLGTSDSGLGGSALLSITPQVSYPDTNTVTIGLPANYKLAGDPVLMPDGAWYIIDGSKELKFVIS